jgi:predicted secreted Zn-dependent protease
VSCCKIDQDAIILALSTSILNFANNCLDKWVHFNVKTSNGKVIDATIDVAITVTMPEWSGLTGSSRAAREEWERFIAALDTHEQGHVLLVGEMLRGLGESLIGKSKSAALGICTKKFSDLNKASKKYDSTTGHGRVQGAVINTSIE